MWGYLGKRGRRIKTANPFSLRHMQLDLYLHRRSVHCLLSSSLAAWAMPPSLSSTAV